MFTRNVRLITAVAALSAFTVFALASDPVPRLPLGAVLGSVVDDFGRPVAGAMVEIKASDGTYVERIMTTSEGKFRFDRLPSDTYRITVAHFQWSAVRDIRLAPRQLQRVQIQLKMRE
jgi:hypothetical protein